MSEFVLMCDTNCDMPKEYFLQNQVEYISMPYFVDNQAYVTFEENDMPVKQFYAVMRAGTMPVTSQVNPETAFGYFEPYAKQGKDILYLAFSSGLSGTYNAALLAAQRLMENYPSVRVRVVDSLCASMGEGLLLHYAVKARDEGKTLDEMVEYLEGLRLHVCHNFTVNDLFHLHRGGRVSKTSAIVGSMLGIKPVLHVDNEGHLINIGKVRGAQSLAGRFGEQQEKQVGQLGKSKWCL